MSTRQLPAPPVLEALTRTGRLPEHIRTLRQAGISQAQMQQVAGPNRISLYNYEHGITQPRDPVVFVIFELWAEAVRQQSQS